MSFNGSGVFVINSSGQPVVADTLITSVDFNNLTADLATGLSNCITKDGQQTVTANIPFGGFKLTGVGAATARTDAATIATIQDGTGVYVATVGGTGDVITLTASPAISAYAAGQRFYFIASAANTTATTVAINGLTTKAITKNGTTALVANDILANSLVSIAYDGTRFILVGVHPSGLYLPLAGGTMTGDLLFTDATYDVGKSGATRPRDGFFSRNVAIGGTLNVTGVATLASPVFNTGVSGTAIAAQSDMDAGTSSTLLPVVSLNKVSLGAPIATTSGTTADFTALPTGIRKITVALNGVSTNSTSGLLLQIGPSTGIVTTGYVSGCTNIGSIATSTAGYLITKTVAAADVTSGLITLILESSSNNTWVASWIMNLPTTAAIHWGTGIISLAGAISKVRLTSVSGDTFDAGEVNITYER